MNTQEKKWYDQYRSRTQWIALAIYVGICVLINIHRHAPAMAFVTDFIFIPVGWFLGSFMMFHAMKWWSSR